MELYDTLDLQLAEAIGLRRQDDDTQLDELGIWGIGRRACALAGVAYPG